MLARMRSSKRCPRRRSWLDTAAFTGAAAASGLAADSMELPAVTFAFVCAADGFLAGTFNVVIFKVPPPRNSDRLQEAPLPDPSRRIVLFPSTPPRHSPSVASRDLSPGLAHGH